MCPSSIYLSVLHQFDMRAGQGDAPQLDSSAPCATTSYPSLIGLGFKFQLDVAQSDNPAQWALT